MNSACTIPVLGKVDVLILGAAQEAVERALSLAAEGKKTAVATRGCCLCEQMALTLCYTGNPDACQKEWERRCRDAGVTIWYRLRPLDRLRRNGSTLVRFGGKFGVAAIWADQVEDYRCDYDDSCLQAYLVSREQPQNVARMQVHCPGGAVMEQRLLAGRRALLERYRQYADGFKLGRFAQRGGKARPLIPLREQTSHPVEAGVELARQPLYPTVVETAPYWGEESSWDVVVVGGGTAGCMAALGAARHGARVALLEPEFSLGGTGTIGGVSSYWFGTRYSDTQEVDTLVEQLTAPQERDKLPGIWSKVDNWNPDVKATALMQLLEDAGVQVFLDSVAFGIWREQTCLCGVAAVCSQGIRYLRGKYLLDATGDGDVAVFAGATSEYGVDGLTYWASLAHYPGPDCYRNNFGAMVVVNDPKDDGSFVQSARQFGQQLFDHGLTAAPRESRHIRGKVRLTLRDLMQHRMWEDGLYTCYSNYDPKGKLNADCVYCGILPPQTMIQIPLSTLIPVDGDGRAIAGMYVLGKAISVSHEIFPSIRMQKDLMHQGMVMGCLVADCLKLGRAPQTLDTGELRALLRQYSDDPLDIPETDCVNLSEAVAMLDAHVRTHWIDADFRDCERVFQPYLAVACASAEQVLPLLRQRLQTAHGPVRRVLIRLTLWHGCDCCTDEWIEYLEEVLEAGLPERQGPTTCAQLLPDHGVMPEIIYDMNLLAYSHHPNRGLPFRKLCDLLVQSKRDYRDIRKGIFPIVEAFAFAAERNGDAQILDCLETLAELPELQSWQTLAPGDAMRQRFALLHLIVHRALARGGRRRGYVGLIGTLELPWLSLRMSAAMALAQLAKREICYDAGFWRAWLDACPELPTERITEKTY